MTQRYALKQTNIAPHKANATAVFLKRVALEFHSLRATRTKAATIAHIDSEISIEPAATNAKPRSRFGSKAATAIKNKFKP